MLAQEIWSLEEHLGRVQASVETVTEIQVQLNQLVQGYFDYSINKEDGRSKQEMASMAYGKIQNELRILDKLLLHVQRELNEGTEKAHKVHERLHNEIIKKRFHASKT